uniref:Putative secreted protein n=1 Tax=Ixodes ricinus TaxID=34613 RepID=A0A6B0V0L0_IXORI
MSGFAALVAHGLVLVLLAADELGRPAVVLGDAGAQGPSHELLLVERGHAAGRRVAVHEEHEGHPFALPGLLVLHHGHPAKRASSKRASDPNRERDGPTYLATLPYFSNSWCRSLFVSLYGRLLTYTVLLLGVRPALIVAGTPGTRNQSRNKPTRTRPSKLEQIMLVLSCGPATQVKRLLHNKP